MKTLLINVSIEQHYKNQLKTFYFITESASTFTDKKTGHSTTKPVSKFFLQKSLIGCFNLAFAL